MKDLRGLLLVLIFTASSALTQTLTITHANLIDVSDGKLHRDTTVVIEGNRVVRVGHSSKRDGAGPGRVIDAQGNYLIPGLWDMHTHVYFGDVAAASDDLFLPLFLANGITGIRDMGSDLDLILHAREEVAAHRIFGPRMVVSGPMLDGPKTRYKAAIAIATPEDGRRAVDMLKSRGVDFIKIQSGVPREAYFAIADEARKAGTEFEGHVPDGIRASEAISAGQRSFEHLIGIFDASSPDEGKYLAGSYLDGTKTIGKFLDTYDTVRETAILQLIATNQVWQCPTLYWERGQWLVDAIDYSQDPDLAYAAHTSVTQWPAWKKGILGTLDVDPLPVRQRFVEHELNIVRKLHAANVQFLAGTDTPEGVDLIPGISLHLELQRFVAAGFTPLQALQTASINPARFFNRLADYGAIQPGRIADLVLLRANPLSDIANTRQIAGVIADGRYLSEQDLDQLRARLRQIAATK